MTREERLKFCSVCTNRAFNPKQGMICGITNEVASFEGTCADYKEDAREVKDGYECGMAFANYNDLQVGDKIECFDVKEVSREL